MPTNFNDTDFELYLLILDNERVPRSPADINMFVSVRGEQYYKNEDGKITTPKNPLKLCDMHDNSTLSNLETAIENRLFKDKPFCIDKAFNYTIMGFDKAKVRKSVSIDISKCVNTSSQTCFSD